MMEVEENLSRVREALAHRKEVVREKRGQNFNCLYDEKFAALHEQESQLAFELAHTREPLLPVTDKQHMKEYRLLQNQLRNAETTFKSLRSKIGDNFTSEAVFRHVGVTFVPPRCSTR